MTKKEAAWRIAVIATEIRLTQDEDDEDCPTWVQDLLAVADALCPTWEGFNG